MLKYKDTYFVIKNKDSKGNIVNKDDNYIPCRKSKAQIYRYSSSLLAIQFTSNGIANSRIKKLNDTEVQLKILQCGDNEHVYIFSEYNLDKVAEVVGAKKKIKRELTNEQREELSLRMKKLHNKE
jgi:hypothetical protein